MVAVTGGRASRRDWRRQLAAAVTGLLASTLLTWAGTVQASAETRSLDIYHMHTGEHEVITFKRDGTYDQQGLTALNHILRDWRRNETVKMDPALFDLIWEVYREAGARGPIQIVCGYRAPETNNMLRSRSRGVAKFSQHTLGKAMDFFLPGVPLEKLREIGMKEQVGGVGFYPTSGSPFVHMDTGGVRAWPRMTHDQLVRLFPDGKTLHLPSDGGPLPGYNQALAEYQQHHSISSTAVATNSRSGKGNVLAALFGMKSGEDDEAETAPAQPAPTSRAAQQATATSRPPAPLPAPQPPRQQFAANLPHLAPKPVEADAAPVPSQPDKPVIMASLPLPPVRPAPQMPAATPASLTQSASLVTVRGQTQAARAPGAILPGGWAQGPAGTPQTADNAEAIAALKAINVPVPAAKPQDVIGAVPKPRPAIMTAGLPTRPIEDAFSALTGTPRDGTASAVLGYAPITPDAAADQRSTTVARGPSAHMQLASLGLSDVTSLGPQPSALSAPGKQSRSAPDTLAKANRGDPMSRLISHVTEALDVRFLDGRSSDRSTLTATFVHPDQESMPQMIVKPAQVLAGNFGSTVAPLSTGRFMGPAVVALAVIETH